MATFEHEAGEGACRVSLLVTTTQGNGIACVLTGGTRPHVGGQVLAAPAAKIRGKRLSGCDLWVSTVPGHKDAEAAAAVARRICLATREPVSVVAGIHVDNATAEQIQRLLAACEAACDAFLARYYEAVGGIFAGR